MGGIKSVISGVAAAVIMWADMLLRWTLDRWVIQNFALGLISWGLAPLVLFVWYVVRCVKDMPNGKSVLLWHACYSFPFLFAWIVAYYGVMTLGIYHPTAQSQRGSIDLTDGAIAWYGLTGVFAFTLLCILFQIVRAATRHGNPENSNGDASSK